MNFKENNSVSNLKFLLSCRNVYLDQSPLVFHMLDLTNEVGVLWHDTDPKVLHYRLIFGMKWMTK